MRRKEHGGIFLRLLFLLIFLGFLAFFYVIRHPLMRFAGELWLVNDPAVQSDVMIVLGDDNYAGDRAAHAADVYRMGMAPIVVASGRALRPYSGMAEMLEHDLESHGVPAASIVKFSYRGENTIDQAHGLAALIGDRGWKRVLVVTSNYHARRARFIFERTLPAGVSVHVSGVRDSEFDPSRWWESRLGQKLFASELLGYIEAQWELRRTSSGPTGAALVVRNTSAFSLRAFPLP